jgi:hypothetical protein
MNLWNHESLKHTKGEKNIKANLKIWDQLIVYYQRSIFYWFFTSVALVRNEVCSLRMVELPKHVAAN